MLSPFNRTREFKEIDFQLSWKKMCTNNTVGHGFELKVLAYKGGSSVIQF